MNEAQSFVFPNLRQPPANLAAEQSLLGGIMCNAKAVHPVAEILRPEHFADSAHGRIFAEQVRRIGAGGMGDAISLRDWWSRDPESEQRGGFGYLAGLIAAHVGAPTNLPYARAIYQDWQRRQLIDAGESVIADAFGDADPDAIVTSAVGKLESAFAATLGHKPVSLNDAMDDALTAMDEAFKRQGPAGLSTGFAAIDAIIGSLEDKTLTVLAGRPGMGKSALGFQIALSVAAQGIGVLAISLEMSARELGRRALSSASGVSVGTIKRGVLTQQQFDRVVAARKRLHDLPLTIEDGGGLTAAMIDMRARAAQRKHGLGLVMVDHLHIIRPEDADVRQGATWAVGRISGAMKRLAKAHSCPVLLLAQLNRAVEGRDDKRPTLADLRQAGDIEQDADAVGFVYRPEYYLPKEPPERKDGETGEKYQQRTQDYYTKRDHAAGAAEVIFAKVRDGATGTAHLRFDGATTSFSDVEQADE